MEQQRTRRHRSKFEQNIKDKLYPSNKTSWDITSITPGTDFMNNLGDTITKYFATQSEKIIVSTSNEPGEGEHKIFSYIRDNRDYHKYTDTYIYGLDADLIMLTLNHLHISTGLYLCREAPHFSKEYKNTDELYQLDINKFSIQLICLMTNKTIDNTHQKDKIHDYIFLCFLLGNDFLPHMPHLSIRNNGINILINHYSNMYNTYKEGIIINGEIVWKNFRRFIISLAKEETTLLRETHDIRDKATRFIIPKGEQQKLINLNYLPMKHRDIEHMINPFKENWQHRYYKHLFDIDIDSVYKKKICMNYLEGLEWIFEYYTYGCSNWKWKYNYSYPPLLSDLLTYIPSFNYPLTQKTINKPVSPYVQLAYVLPKESHYLIATKYKKIMKNNKFDWYTENPIFKWAYCKFFWESHIELPEVNIDTIEKCFS